MNRTGKKSSLYHLTKAQCCKYITDMISPICRVYGVYLCISYSIVLWRPAESKRIKPNLLYCLQ